MSEAIAQGAIRQAEYLIQAEIAVGDRLTVLQGLEQSFCFG
jgi:hypothetical protein